MSVSLAVVIPAGPADDVVDTVESVLAYTEPPRLVVVIDDTGRDVAGTLRSMSHEIHVLPPPPGRQGWNARIWLNVAIGYRHALAAASFDVLLRLDADALIIGAGLAEAAAERFARDQRIGMLGSSRLGMDGRTRDLSWPAAALRRECGVRGLDRPVMRRALRALRHEARKHGYEDGEHALGAAYLQPAGAVRTIAERGWLELAGLERTSLADDHLLGLMTVAAGFQIGEFGGPDDPLALGWKSLPANPEELLARCKLATHSVRGWANLDEQEIRAQFRRAREARQP